MTDQFEKLKVNENYEIEKQYPHRIRKIGNKGFVNEYHQSAGYIQLKLNGKLELKHRLIAEQFIENDNPDEKIQVDHINHIRTDNRIENLRWVTRKENRSNRKPHIRRTDEYLEELPENIFEISDFNGHEFEDYYFDVENEQIIKRTNVGRLKIIKPFLDGNTLRICLCDIEKKRRMINFDKLIRTFKHALKRLNQNESDDDWC